MSQLSYFGEDSWTELNNWIVNNEIKSVLLVTGRTMYRASGAEEKMAPILEPLRHRRVYDFQVNPQTQDLSRLLDDLHNDSPYELIIAIGGGSVIDIAKLLKAFWTSRDPVSDLLSSGNELRPSPLPLIAIPSTAGSGSEATQFAVVYHNRVKHSVSHPELLPDISYIIPSLLTSLPKATAAASGMDALCQGIESYWSIHSTEQSRKLASEAIQLAWSALIPAIVDQDPSAREDLARASHLAGRAINITKTTAPHAVSYAFSAFFGIPHGHAVGILTPSFLEFNSQLSSHDVLDPRGVEFAKDSLSEIAKILNYENCEEAAKGLREKMQNLGLEQNIATLGIANGEDIETILENGFNPDRVNNNPRRVEKNSLRTLLLKLQNL